VVISMFAALSNVVVERGGWHDRERGTHTLLRYDNGGLNPAIDTSCWDASIANPGGKSGPARLRARALSIRSQASASLLDRPGRRSEPPPRDRVSAVQRPPTG
jgi:hypothetical protein